MCKETPAPQEQEASKQFNRAEARKQTVERLRGQAWDLYTTAKQRKTGWTASTLKNEVLFTDPDRIEVGVVHGEAALSKYIHLGWHHVGQTESGAYVLVAPIETELGFSRLAGVDVSLDRQSRPVIKIDTLFATLIPVISFDDYHLEGEKDEAVEIDIERVLEDGTRGDAKSKNPQIARHTFFSEIHLLAEQLRAMGYHYVFASPSDERRSRVYRRMGMKPIGDNELYAPIEDLLKRYQ